MVVIWAVNSDVLFTVCFERIHELEEVFLTASVAHVSCGEVSVHAGAIPVTFERLTVPFDVNFVFLSEAKKEEASHPDFISCSLGAFAEYLEFPLTFSHLSIDAFVVDTSVETEL